MPPLFAPQLTVVPLYVAVGVHVRVSSSNSVATHQFKDRLKKPLQEAYNYGFSDARKGNWKKVTRCRMKLEYLEKPV